jgi:hypothetical protein
MAPNVQACIKLHRQNTSNRPIINSKNVPGYWLAKHVSKRLHNYLHLPNAYNVQNSICLSTDLKSMENNEDIRMCSFDIENMYTNISKIEVVNIIE